VCVTLKFISFSFKPLLAPNPGDATAKKLTVNLLETDKYRQIQIHITSSPLPLLGALDKCKQLKHAYLCPHTSDYMYRVGHKNCTRLSLQ